MNRESNPRAFTAVNRRLKQADTWRVVLPGSKYNPLTHPLETRATINPIPYSPVQTQANKCKIIFYVLNYALRHDDVDSVEVRPHLILTSPLDGDDWSVPRSDLSVPEEIAPTPTRQ